MFAAKKVGGGDPSMMLCAKCPAPAPRFRRLCPQSLLAAAFDRKFVYQNVLLIRLIILLMPISKLYNFSMGY